MTENRNGTCSFAAFVVLEIKKKSTKEILICDYQPALDQRALDTIFESGGESVAPYYS